MKAYSFRLAGVARVRQLEEGIAAQELAAATHEVARATNALSRSGERLAQLATPGGIVSAADVHWTQDQAHRLAETCRADLAVLEAAVARRSVARERWLVARRRCAVLERLDDRRRGEWQSEYDRAEAKELDDMASARSLGRRTATSGAGW